MAAFGDLIVVVVVGFVVVAVLSLLTIGAPATPSFARRAATSGSVQLRQDPNAGFILDRGFLFRRRVWFTATYQSKYLASALDLYPEYSK